MDINEVLNRFTFHPANTQERREDHETVRAACRKLVETLFEVVPNGREKALMITHLEETMFWANAAVAREC